MPIKHIKQFAGRLFGGRFIYLLATQLVLFLAYPFLNQGNVPGEAALEVLYVLVLVSCLRVLTADARPLRITVFVLLLLILVLRAGEYLVPSHPLQVTGLLFDILFHAIVCVVIIGHVMKVERVNADKIIGASCAYLFIGVLFSLIFALIDALAPGSFSFGARADAAVGPLQGVERGMSFLYFSFITLTTVGYGDVLPATQLAEALAAMEAVIGQLYLTVLVARLVGLNIAYSHERIRADRSAWTSANDREHPTGPPG